MSDENFEELDNYDPSKNSSESTDTQEDNDSDVLTDQDSKISEDQNESEKTLTASVEGSQTTPPNPLDELTDQQLVDVVMDLEIDCKRKQLENIIFYDYLRNNDPSSLEGFQVLLDFAKGKGPPPPELLFDVNTGRSAKIEASFSSILESRGPTINLSYKSDMVAKATEDTQAKLQTFMKKSEKIRRALRADLEEFSIRESDTREARDIFEFNIVTQGVDKLTQRIPAEKFIRYMEDWLKSATLNIEKLRLRTASLNVHLKKVYQILVQRQELGENVHAVDFDQLEIENKHFINKIEQKNFHLIELKKMNGGANLILSKNKKYLYKQQQEFNSLKKKLRDHDKQMAELEKECETAQEESNKAKHRLEYIMGLKNSYIVPDVMEYIKIKRELNEYRKNLKVWHRRKKIQDITLNACLRQMKNLTASSAIDPMWYVDPSDDSEDEQL